MDLAQTMKSRRKTFGITQQDLAEIEEVSLATVKDIERGHRNPSLRTVQKILEVLGMEINYQVRKVVP